MKKKRLSKVCRGFGMPVPEGVRIINLYGFNIMRHPNTKLTRLQRAVLWFHVKLFGYRTWDSQANFDRLHESAKMGGSFNRDIIAAFFSADWDNKPRLVEAFPEIFKP